jgi:peptidyl-prolyl cis-trans isomerase SurA
VKRLGLFLALLGPLALVSTTPAHAEVVDRVAAVVNKEVITLSEVYDYGGDFIEQQVLGAPRNDPRRRALELEVLDFLIQRALVNQEVRELGMDVTRDELERALEDTAGANGMTRDQLRVEVERSGLSWSVYRTETEDALRQMKFNQSVLMQRIAVTDDEVLDLYQRRVKTNTPGGARSLSVVFLPATDEAGQVALMERAQAISDAAAAGTSWQQILGENPDSLYASSGGDMGSLREEEAVREMRVVFDLPVGGISGPILLSNGAVMVAKVVSEEAGQAPDMSMVEGDLRNELSQAKMMEEMELWYAQARRKASVKILLEAPEALL